MDLPKREKYLILVSLSSASFLTTFTASALNIALPSIGKELNMSHSELQYIISAYLIVNATMLVPFGKLADIIGRKIFFITGFILFLIAHLLAAFATSGWALVACRGFAGLAASMFFSNNIAILSSVFPKQERGKALGVNVSIAYMGITTGPFIGGMITSYLGWRAIFLCIVPIIAVSLLMSWTRIPNDFKKGNLGSFDLKSALLYVPAFLFTIIGITMLPSVSGTICTAIGFTLMVYFSIMDLKALKPFMGIRYFIRNRLFVFSNLANFLQYLSTSAAAFMLSLFLQNKGILGLQAKTAGLVLLAQPIMQFIISPLAGALSDRIEPRYLASLGMGLSGFSLLAFAMSGPQTNVIVIVVLLLVMGAGIGFFTSPNNNSIMSSIRPKVYGIGSGILSTGRILGMSMSIAVTAIVFNIFESSESDVASFIISFRAVFIIFFLASIIGLIASLISGKQVARKTKMEIKNAE